MTYLIDKIKWKTFCNELDPNGTYIILPLGDTLKVTPFLASVIVKSDCKVFVYDNITPDVLSSEIAYYLTLDPTGLFSWRISEPEFMEVKTYWESKGVEFSP